MQAYRIPFDHSFVIRRSSMKTSTSSTERMKDTAIDFAGLSGISRKTSREILGEIVY